MAGEQVIRVYQEQVIDVYPEARISQPSIVESDVNLFDYDGTLLASYTRDEFLELSEFPAGGEHDGLTPCGWNWPLDKAKEWVERVGWLDIGFAYKPTDEKSHIFFELPDTLTDAQFGLAVNGEALIEWGDGTSSTLTGTSISSVKWTDLHEYETGGAKEITITVTGAAALIGSSSYCCLRYAASSALNNYYINAVKEIQFGKNLAPGNYGTGYLRNLERVVFSPFVTNSGQNCCSNNISLRCAVLPDGLTTIDQYLANYSATRVIIPYSATTQGTYPFSNQMTMRNLVVMPSGTGAAPALQMTNGSVQRIAFGNGVTTIGNITGTSISEILLPDSLTALPNSFVGSSLQRLESITIPANVASMGTACFQSCNGLKELHFKGTTPPTTSNNCFNSFPSRCKIFVPMGCLEAYTSADRFPSPTTITYIEE